MQTIHDRIEDYLNGQLSEAETLKIETDLLNREVAGALREALMIRELLSSLPSDEPPPGLAERIENSLSLDSSPAETDRNYKRSAPLGQVVNGFKWGLHWSGYTLAGMSGNSPRLKSAFLGMETIGYSLGPLKKPVRNRINTIRSPQKPLWKIALSKLW